MLDLYGAHGASVYGNQGRFTQDPITGAEPFPGHPLAGKTIEVGRVTGSGSIYMYIYIYI